MLVEISILNWTQGNYISGGRDRKLPAGANIYERISLTVFVYAPDATGGNSQ